MMMKLSKFHKKMNMKGSTQKGILSLVLFTFSRFATVASANIPQWNGATVRSPSAGGKSLTFFNSAGYTGRFLRPWTQWWVLLLYYCPFFHEPQETIHRKKCSFFSNSHYSSNIASIVEQKQDQFFLWGVIFTKEKQKQSSSKINTDKNKEKLSLSFLSASLDTRQWAFSHFCPPSLTSPFLIIPFFSLSCINYTQHYQHQQQYQKYEIVK